DWEGERNFKKMKSISNEYPKHLKCSAKRSISNYEIKKEILSESRFILVSPSNWLNSVIKNLYLKNSKIITIYNGIDTEKFEPNDIHEQSKHINILGVANIWESYKSLKYFERLAGGLDVTYFITLVGALHDKKQLHPRIKHVERTQPINELVEYYTQADIFV